MMARKRMMKEGMMRRKLKTKRRIMRIRIMILMMTMVMRMNKSSKDCTWSAVPDALLRVIN